MQFDETEFERDRSLGDKYGYIMSDANRGLFRSLLNDDVERAATGIVSQL